VTQAAPEDRIACHTLAPGIRVAVTGRAGGVSKPPYDTLNLGRSVGDDPAAVARNRVLLAEACGVEPSRMTWMRQVHGTEVVCVTGPAGAGQPGYPECDAVFTAAPGLPLAVLAADCAPVLLADPDAGLVGAAHAGRAGMEAGVVPVLIRAMAAAGAAPSRMRALIGPAVCGGCYEVPEGLRARVSAAVPQAHCVTRRGLPGLDITAGIAAQLAAAGIPDVRHDGRCTAESPELYSHRRDRRTGRFAAVIWLGD
jgi:polyphenol oxidase